MQLSSIFSEPLLNKVCPVSYIWEGGDGGKRSFSSEFCVIFEGELQSILSWKIINQYLDTLKPPQGFFKLLRWDIFYINTVLLHLTRKKWGPASPKSFVHSSCFLVMAQRYFSRKLSWLCALCLINYVCILYFSTQNWSWYFYLAFGLQIQLSLSTSRSVFVACYLIFIQWFCSTSGEKM